MVGKELPSLPPSPSLTFHHSDFFTTFLPCKAEFSLKFFTVLKIVFTFRVFEQLVLALKNRVCPEFTVLNIYFLSFRILNNLRLPWKTEFALPFFTLLKYFLFFRVFEELELALKTEFALNFSSRGDGSPPPPRTPLVMKSFLRPVASLSKEKGKQCPRSPASLGVTDEVHNYN